MLFWVALGSLFSFLAGFRARACPVDAGPEM